MQIDIEAACGLLQTHDRIVILVHQKPDGDTLGSGFALLYALEQLGKTARVESPDGFPERYQFMYGGYKPKEFEAAYVVTVDVASPQLLGRLQEAYKDRIDLCIDHHKSNELPARHILLDGDAPAAAQIIYKVLRGLGAKIDKPIANALFTGLSTDTGCFKYTNVTPDTHRIAAEMIEAGAEHGEINKRMFDTKSKGRLAVEKQLLDTLEYYFDNQCAMVTLAQELTRQYGVHEDELDGISAIPRRIEGVKAGVSIRAQEDGAYRISLRTGEGVDASRICAALGGGGHMNAAGCTLTGTLKSAKKHILREIEKELERLAV